MADALNAGHIAAIVPSDDTVHRGMLYLLVVADGDLVLRGLNNAVVPAFPVVAGQHVRFTDGKVMAATTAELIVFG